MVSNASEDLPLPLSPVTTTSRSRGRLRSMFLRLCCRAPRISMVSRGTVSQGIVPFSAGAALYPKCALTGTCRVGELSRDGLLAVFDSQGTLELDDLVAQEGGLFELELAS